MALDIHSVRRRAVVAVLGEILDEAALIEALWQQQETMRGDGVSDIISYIDAVAQRHMFDASLTRRLYTDLHKAMRLPEDKLPLDPLPAMQAHRSARAPAPAPAFSGGMSFGGAGYPSTPRAVPAPVPVPQPVPVPYPQPVPVPVPAPVPVAAPVAPPPVEQAVVFGALMRTALLEVIRSHRDALDEVRKDALVELETSRVPMAMRPAVRDAWARGADHYWVFDADLQSLAELVRVLYMALSQAFGRVGADQILARAIETAEHLPEARRYSPKRLLYLL